MTADLLQPDQGTENVIHIVATLHFRRSLCNLWRLIGWQDMIYLAMWSTRYANLGSILTLLLVSPPLSKFSWKQSLLDRLLQVMEACTNNLTMGSFVASPPATPKMHHYYKPSCEGLRTIISQPYSLLLASKLFENTIRMKLFFYCLQIHTNS